MHPTLQHAMAEAHQRDLLAQAQRRGLASEVRRRPYRSGRVGLSVILRARQRVRHAPAPRRGTAAMA